MNYHLENSAGSPAYLQLYRLLANDITGGVYPYGTKLPSKRLIAAETGVSVITVQHALALLCDEGYAEARERSGCFVIYRDSDFQVTAKARIGEEPNNVQVNRHAGGFPFTVLSRAMRKVLLDYGDSILGRSPNHGCSELTDELRAYLARSIGIEVSAEQIVIGSGAEYLYGLIVQLLGTGGVYAIEDPSYEKIRKVYTAMGASIKPLPLESDGIAKEELYKSGAGVLHVTPFHSYPSGVSVNINKKREYLRWAAETSGYIVEDNYDSELTVSSKPEDSLFLMSGGERVIYINTFSHTIAPSVRIGYMVLPKGLTVEFGAKLGFYSCTVPLFDQYVLAELLRSGEFERHINRVRRKRRAENGGRA